MAEWLSDFHWLRPLWLIAIVPGLLLTYLWLRRPPQPEGWSHLIAPSLLPYLTRSVSGQQQRRRAAWLLATLWLLACLGLAGPTATTLPQPLQRDISALVVVFDLSPSMRTRDLSPDRLTLARLKTIDFLRERHEGMTGLVIYAGDAYPVVPMTTDINTILHLVPELEPEIMPSPGSHVEAALRQGIELLITGGHRTGRLLLVTDGVTSEAQRNVDQLMRQFGEYRLDILGVGTADGGPIPLPDGGFARDRNDRIVVASLPEQRLRNLATRSGGRYATLTPDDRDLEHLLAPYRGRPDDTATEATDRAFDLWHDLGYVLALLALPVLLMTFRRGLVASLVLAAPLLLNPPAAHALEWVELWQRPDQRGQQALQEGDPERAQSLFRDPLWRGLAAYESGDFVAAEAAFATDDSARGHYNRGNALAAQGRFDAAIAAYDEALAREPDMEAAHHNRELARALQLQQPSQDEAEPKPEGRQPQDEHEPESHRSEEHTGDSEPSPETRQPDAEPPSATTPKSPEPEPPGEDVEPRPDGDTPPQTPPPTAEPPSDAEDASASEAPAAPGEDSTDSVEPDTSADPADERMEQWLRRVPDNPGGLLRRQLQREAVLRLRESQRARSLPPGAAEEERW